MVCSPVVKFLCAGPESLVRKDPTFTGFLFCFLVDEGREDQNTTKSRPLSPRQPNAIRWRFTVGPIMAWQHWILAWV